jgi:hypothetical protein
MMSDNVPRVPGPVALQCRSCLPDPTTFGFNAMTSPESHEHLWRRLAADPRFRYGRPGRSWRRRDQNSVIDRQ